VSLSERTITSLFGDPAPGTIRLVEVSKTDFRLRQMMKVHYSQPKGFVGRSICYLVVFDQVVYGGIVGGSATLHLPGRNDFLSVDKSDLSGIVNNTFYHVQKMDDSYPARNFTVKVLEKWRQQIRTDWTRKYGDEVTGFESLVELPRTGEIYKREGWTLVGQTVGYTCKRTAGTGTDSWSGKRVWNTDDLRPKNVFCRKAD
jgi:hypothetical protein